MALFEKKDTSSVAMEVAECDRQIAWNRQRRAELVMQVGEMFIANSTDLAGTPYDEIVRAVRGTEREIVNLEKRKLAAQGLRRCEKCGNILVLDSAFCNKCGEKLGPLFEDHSSAPAPAQVAQNICPKCGVVCDTGAMFCTSCGNKLG